VDYKAAIKRGELTHVTVVNSLISNSLFSHTMNNTLKKIELVANLSIIALAIVMGMTLARIYMIPAPPKADVDQTRRPETLVGSKVELPDVDWKAGRQTLVLALSASCHFCSDSAPFYRELAEKRGDTRIIAVLPQPASGGKVYLKKHAVPVDEVRQIQLGSLGVSGTPTLLLVNSSGVVTDSWVGKLGTEKETEVLNKVQAANN
jgi:hypothetical protein